jgi:hypothetical protein
MDDLLRDALRARAADPAAACLDPEAAAALIDGTMSARARAGAEAHLADCARCQALLGALARVSPPPAEPPWWRRPAIAWLTPLTVAATAVAIWINVADRAGVAPVQPARDDVQALASAPIETPPAPARAAPEPRSFSESAAARSPESGPVRGRETMVDSAKAPPVPPRARGNASDARQVEPPPPASAPAPAALAAPQPPPAVTEPSPAQVAQTGAAQPSARSADSNTSAAGAAEPVRPSALLESVVVARQAPSLPDTTIVSSNGMSQWRIGPGSEVQHSADGGKTWRTQATGMNVTPVAGSSPSPSVCWLVGPGGVVSITTDEGRSWRRVPFPIDADLVFVRATDARTASVATSDGRTFVTSDGGRNWRP